MASTRRRGMMRPMNPETKAALTLIQSPLNGAAKADAYRGISRCPECGQAMPTKVDASPVDHPIVRRFKAAGTTMAALMFGPLVLLGVAGFIQGLVLCCRIARRLFSW